VTDTATNDVRLAVSIITTLYVPLERALTGRGFSGSANFLELPRR
jgi:hypothetical protein